MWAAPDEDWVQIQFACHITYCKDCVIHFCLMSRELKLQIYTLTFTSKYTSTTAIVNMCNSQPWMLTCSLWITNQWACISLKPFSTWGFSCDGRMNRRETGTSQRMPGCPTWSMLVTVWNSSIYRYTETLGSYSTGCKQNLFVSVWVYFELQGVSETATAYTLYW